MDIRDSIFESLKSKNLTLSTCESMTGGMISSAIVDYDGASLFYKGSIICYSNESKIRILSIPESIVKEHGSISEIVSEKMAVSCNKLMNTDICISVTGNAGPNPIEQKEVGTCYLSICIIDKVYTYKYVSKLSDRNSIRSDITVIAFRKLKDFISK
jgi:PncC family amidohydrolase